ncbi:hypothetical protein ACRN83_001137 [Enterobacter hormaechei]
MKNIYTIDIYSKQTEDLLFEIEVSSEKADEMVDILGLKAKEREEFMRVIGVYNLSKNQAPRFELLVGKYFVSDDATLQISGGGI